MQALPINQPQELVQFLPFDQPQKEEVCTICQNAEEENAWVGHEAKTNDQNSKVQHIFHEKCIKKALIESSSDCPLCRKPVKIVGFIDDLEIQQFHDRELNATKTTLEKEIYNAHLVSYRAAGVFLIFLKSLDSLLGIRTNGLITCFASAGIGGLVVNDSLPANINSYNGVFSGLALATLNLIDPLGRAFHFLSPDSVYGICAPAIYTLAMYELSWYFSPTELKIIPGEGERRTALQVSAQPGPFAPIIAALVARSVWNYYQG